MQQVLKMTQWGLPLHPISTKISSFVVEEPS